MKNESVKNVSACDWSNLVGRLTGKNQPGHLQSCIRQQPKWLSENEAVCLSDRPVWPDETSSKKLLLSARFRPVWPSSLHLPHLGGPKGGRECSLGLAID